MCIRDRAGIDPDEQRQDSRRISAALGCDLHRTASGQFFYLSGNRALLYAFFDREGVCKKEQRLSAGADSSGPGGVCVVRLLCCLLYTSRCV